MREYTPMQMMQKMKEDEIHAASRRIRSAQERVDEYIRHAKCLHDLILIRNGPQFYMKDIVFTLDYHEEPIQEVTPPPVEKRTITLDENLLRQVVIAQIASEEKWLKNNHIPGVF